MLATMIPHRGAIDWPQVLHDQALLDTADTQNVLREGTNAQACFLATAAYFDLSKTEKATYGATILLSMSRPAMRKRGCMRTARG